MIRLFAGKDTFESFVTAKKTAERTAKENNTNLQVIDATEISELQQFILNFEGIGLFSAPSTFFIKRLTENKNILEYFTNNLEALNSFEIIIWEDKAIDNRIKLSQYLKKNSVLFNYEEPREGDIRKWISDRLKADGFKLTSGQLNTLVEHGGVEKWLLDNELQKIKTYLLAKDKDSISDKELDSILGFDVRGNIWKFLDYFGYRKKKDCISEFSRLVSYDESIQYLLSMINREVSIMLQIKYIDKKNLDIRSLKLHPFVLKKSQEKSKLFKFEELQLFLKKLLDLDFSIKKGELEEKTGLLLYLLMV
jgi:DNA polymerase-3 subunit delta